MCYRLVTTPEPGRRPVSCATRETSSVQKYRGLLLSAEAGRNLIYSYQPRARGAGFVLERSELVSSLATPNENYIWNQVDEDRRKWFRPSDVAVGADGAIYVADWYDPIIGGHQMHDGKGYGRIYRITPKGRTLTTPALDLSTTAGQVQALLSPAVNVRSSGFERLKAQRRRSAVGGAQCPRRSQPVSSRARGVADGAPRPGRRRGSRATAGRSRRAAPHCGVPCPASGQDLGDGRSAPAGDRLLAGGAARSRPCAQGDPVRREPRHPPGARRRI